MSFFCCAFHWKLNRQVAKRAEDAKNNNRQRKIKSMILRPADNLNILACFAILAAWRFQLSTKYFAELREVYVAARDDTHDFTAVGSAR